ncbi:MAG: beta-lactamase family protein [Phycisphaerales bacterium]|nr:beta-lactamase family protein [Phycisphaerales bacterium]
MRRVSALMLAAWLFSGTAMLCADTPENAVKPQPATAEVLPASKAAFDASADYSAKFGGRAVLIMHEGKVIYERFDNGWKANQPHPLASGTKSFTGVVAAAAVHDGLITWDERASDTITEWKGDPRKSKITVRQLLSLSSGLDPADALLGGRGGSRLLGQGAADRAKRLGGENTPRPKDFFLAAIGVEAKRAPGERFEYGPSHFFAFGELLERKIEAKHAADKSFRFDSFDAYMRGRVMEPLGIKYMIGRDSVGHPNLPGGALLTPREWAKFGQFVLQKGQWDSGDGKMQPLIAWEHLAECFKPSPKNAAYGLTWWLRTDAEATLIADVGRSGTGPEAGEKNRDAGAIDGSKPAVYMAAGLGKQRLYVIPDQKLVVVRFAEATREGRAFKDAEFLRPIVGALTPSVGAKP